MFPHLSPISHTYWERLCCSLGSAHGRHRNESFSLEQTVTLSKGINYISLLSAMVGLRVNFDLSSCSIIFSMTFLSNDHGKETQCKVTIMFVICHCCLHGILSQIYFLCEG